MTALATNDPKQLPKQLDKIAPLPDSPNGDRAQEGAVTPEPADVGDLVPVHEWMPSFASAGE